MLFGAAVGAIVKRAATKNSGAIIGGELIGAATEIVTGSFVKDVTCTAITDIQISECATVGTIIRETLQQDLAKRSSGSHFAQASSMSSWKRYLSRVVNIANQANLDFEEAAPQLVDGLTRSIAGVF